MAYHRYFMNFFFILVISFFLIYPLAAKNSYLVNKDYIASHLTHKAPWADSHDASGHYLGCGMLYYALAYMMRAHVCVCLGSGGGFVPRLMRQAQRDLCLTDSTTILIDGNMGPYGRPKWLSSQSFFKKKFMRSAMRHP